ncbi:MAG: hypothetical protein AB7O32_10215, partial [Vicinamibacterales bacterium]
MTEPKPIERGHQVPDFDVRTVQGREFRYSTIWQRKNLLLVLLPPSGGDGDYVAELDGRAEAFQQLDAECVITRGHIPGLHPPAVLLADRWGEVVHVAPAPEPVRAEVLLEWLEYIQHR